MAGHSPGLTKSYLAGAAIGARRIVKWGAADGAVILGAAATDKLMGVTSEIDAASGERVDVFRSGLVDVVYGGTVARGDPLTSDAAGAAVAAAPATGVNNRIVGYAEVSAVAGDIGPMMLGLSTIQGG